MSKNNNFLPKFEISDDLSVSLRNIEIAKALSTGWYKGQIDYHLRKADLVKMIDGEEYYTPALRLKSYSLSFFKKGTKGYHVAEFLRLLGMEDEDLKELRKVSSQDSTDAVMQSWRAKEEMSSGRFKKEISIIKEQLTLVDTIEIDYENQRYKVSDYPLESTRTYNSKESIYGNVYNWGQIQGNFNDENWTLDNRIITLQALQTRDIRYSFGIEIRFMRSGIDVSSEYSDSIKYAVQSMIAYSGTEFMDRLSFSKKTEKDYMVKQWTIDDNGDYEAYKSVIGTEVFDATVKTGFLEDVEDKHFIRYTAYKKEARTIGRSLKDAYYQLPTELEGRVPLERLQTGFAVEFTFTNPFWQFVKQGTEDNPLKIFPIVREGDESLFLDTGNRTIGAYINVKEFRKLSMDDLGYYLQEYFDIKVTTKDAGFFEGFIGFIAGLLGKILDFAFDIINAVPILKLQLQILTMLVNKVFGSDLTERELFNLGIQVIWNVIGAVFAPVTAGVSLAISTALSLAVAGSEAEEAKDKAEKQAERDKAEKEERTEERKKEQEAEEKRKTLNGESQESEREEFMLFLKNPLYKLDREKKQLESDFRSQFKLL